jgi:hypothetical protein
MLRASPSPAGAPRALRSARLDEEKYNALAWARASRVSKSSTLSVAQPDVRSGTGPSKFRMQTEVQNANRNFIEISQKVAEIVCKFIEISPKFHGVCLRIVRAPTQRASTSKTTAATNSHHASTPKTTRGGLPKSVAPRVDFRRIDDDRRQEFPSPRKF